MQEYTLSFNEKANGWTSFHSFIPDFMIGMNSYFYSFKNGELYRHNTNDTRCNFYGTQYTAKVTGVFNTDYSMTKNYNTFNTNNSLPWDTNLTTDLSTGYIDSEFFVEKEGNYFAYIRSSSDDVNKLKLRSTQGIGKPLGIDLTVLSSVIISFTNKVETIINVGDYVYKKNSTSVLKIGKIVGRSSKSITVDTTVSGGNVPSYGDFLLCIKNSVAESYGLKGYYMQFELENTSTSGIKLFNVTTDIFKSFP